MPVTRSLTDRAHALIARCQCARAQGFDHPSHYDDDDDYTSEENDHEHMYESSSDSSEEDDHGYQSGALPRPALVLTILLAHLTGVGTEGVPATA